MAWVIGITRHENQHIVVEIQNDIIFMVKLLIVKKTSKKILGCGLGDNGKSFNTDLFQKGTTILVGDIFL